MLTIVAVRDELRCAAAVLLARWRARGSCPTTCLHLNSSLGPDPIPQCPTCSGSMSRRRRRRASNRETRAGGLHSGGEWAPPWVTNYTAASDAGSGNIYSALHGPCKLTQQRRRSAAEGASEGSEFRVKYNSKPLTASETRVMIVDIVSAVSTRGQGQAANKGGAICLTLTYGTRPATR